MADDNSSLRIKHQEIMDIRKLLDDSLHGSDITYCREMSFNLYKRIGSRNIYVQCNRNTLTG